MIKPKEYQPLYQDFIKNVEKGFLMLDEKSQQEVTDFISHQQHQNGAFTDRAGNPDLYYSLFGAWMSTALKLKVQQKRLADYIKKNQPVEQKIVKRFSHLLISVSMENDIKKPSIPVYLKMAFSNNRQINVAYKAFLFLLSFDALYGRQPMWFSLFRAGLTFYRSSENLPCSFISALLIGRFLTGMKTMQEQKQLFSYFEEGKGFKIYRESENGDLLSTAVALFALKKTGADLRMAAPDALNLVQQNFESGAFLSGDGDETRDLEYTFYGLLILGTLSE